VCSVHLSFQQTVGIIFDIGQDESDDPQTAAGVGRGKKKELWELPKNSAGKAIIPSLEEMASYSLNDKKHIVRSFLTYSYRMFHILSLYIFVSLVQVISPTPAMLLSPGTRSPKVHGNGLRIGIDTLL
jgi:hypothetical protein